MDFRPRANRTIFSSTTKVSCCIRLERLISSRLSEVAVPAGGYCGNPTATFKSNPGENYAYVNFFDTVGYFDQVLLYSTGSAGFESTNHSVAYVNPLVVSGTTFDAPDRPPSAAVTAKFAILVPEPASVMLVVTPLVVLFDAYNRRRAGQAKAKSKAQDGNKEGRRRRRSRSRTRPAQIGWPSSSRSRFSS